MKAYAKEGRGGRQKDLDIMELLYGPGLFTIWEK